LFYSKINEFFCVNSMLLNLSLQSKSPNSYMEKITILLVDDHKLIRDSWSFILNSDPRFTVIAETSSGEEAIEIARDKRPNIVLMDVNMSPVNGFDATRQIHKLSPDSRII